MAQSDDQHCLSGQRLSWRQLGSTAPSLVLSRIPSWSVGLSQYMHPSSATGHRALPRSNPGPNRKSIGLDASTETRANSQPLGTNASRAPLHSILPPASSSYPSHPPSLTPLSMSNMRILTEIIGGRAVDVIDLTEDGNSVAVTVSTEDQPMRKSVFHRCAHCSTRMDRGVHLQECLCVSLTMYLISS